MSTSGRMIRITVSHDSSQFELCLPAESTFGEVKRLLAHKTGLEPEEQRLIFRGKEKQEEERLHLEGVKDNSEVVLFEDAASKEKKLTEIRKKFDMLKASEAIAGVRAEVDELSERMVALEAAVNGGTKVAENEFHALAELLMRQLLKLDTIEAEGEARLQRKAEVCRVQNYVDRLDSLKERNSMPLSDSSISFSEGTSDTFDSGMGSMNAPSPMSSSGKVIRDSEQFDCSEVGMLELQDAQVLDEPRVENETARTKDPQMCHQREAKEETERGSTSGTSELEDPVARAQPEVHIKKHPTSKVSDARAQIEGEIIKEVVGPEIAQLPQTLIGGSLARDSLEEAIYINVSEILRVISPSLAIPTIEFPLDPLAATRAPASVATSVARSVAALCKLDDGGTKLMEVAFNKYPNLMMVRSDRRMTFIQWMFRSLSNLLHLLSTASAGTLDAPKMSEIEVVLRELETFGFDAGFIYEMRLQVSEAWEARVAVDNATLDLKTLCTKAEGLNQEIADMERSLAAAKAEVAQVEAKISILCDFVEKNGTPIFRWIE